MATLVLAGCAKKELEEIIPAQGTVITFEGNSEEDTKVSIGEGPVLLWYTGDALGIYDVDTTVFYGQTAELYGESSGKKKGVFQTVSEVIPEKDLELYLTYPAAYVSYKAAGIVGSVNSVQSQRKANSSIHIGNNCVAYAKTSIKAGQTEGISFTLNQMTAFVKVKVSSSEFASAELVSVKLWAPGKALSGTITVDPKTGSAAYSATKDYAGVTISNTSALSSEQDVYFTALPCDLTGTDVYVIVTMKDGQKTIEIPVKMAGKELKAQALNVITVSNLSLSDNTFDWYNPVETRYVAAFGEGWSYGDQNCYTAMMGGDAVTMDVRARGNFMRCTKPAYILVQNACELNASNKNNLEFNGTNGWDGSAYVKIPLNGNYTVSVKALKAGSYLGYASKVKLLDENSDCIWAFNIWALGSEITGQTMKNGVIMDRNLGAAIKDIEFKTSTRPSDGRGCYYQWGRPFQTGWSSSGGLFIQAATVVTDLAISAANPEKFYHLNNNTITSGGDWYLGANPGARSEHIDDLWGNQNTTGDQVVSTKGTKSIYDPCPKGWMVACPALLNEMYSVAELDVTDASMYRMVYKYGDETVTLSFGGCKWGSNGGNCDNTTTDICALWSNSTVTSYEQNGANAHMFYYRYKEGAWSAPEKQSGNRAHGYPVRCMKDDENR